IGSQPGFPKHFPVGMEAVVAFYLLRHAVDKPKTPVSQFQQMGQERASPAGIIVDHMIKHGFVSRDLDDRFTGFSQVINEARQQEPDRRQKNEAIYAMARQFADRVALLLGIQRMAGEMQAV